MIGLRSPRCTGVSWEKGSDGSGHGEGNPLEQLLTPKGVQQNKRTKASNGAQAISPGKSVGGMPPGEGRAARGSSGSADVRVGPKYTSYLEVGLQYVIKRSSIKKKEEERKV